MATLLTDGFLARAVLDFRRYIDEPSLNAKYTDAVLYEMIGQSYVHIIGEVNRNSTEPVVARFEVTYVAGQATYILPATKGSIRGIYVLSDAGLKVFYDSRSELNPMGQEVWVEGCVLHIQSNIFSAGNVITVEYQPSGRARLHNGTCTVDATGKLVTFGATPTTGTLDTHAHAYTGSIFRLITSDSSSFDFTQERTISSYANITRVATLDTALDPIPTSGTTSYEIAPAVHRGFDHVVALYLAQWVAALEGNAGRRRSIRDLYKDAMRTLRLDFYYSNLVEAPKMRGDNFNRRRFSNRQIRGLL